MDERYQNEINHLMKIKTILDQDVNLTLRFEIERLSLDFRRFKVTIRGLQSLINNPNNSTRPVSDNFQIIVEVPSGYPWLAIPNIKFNPPIPFHPHIHKDGRICWGETYNSPQPDLTIVDWIRGVVEYLQYNQDEGSFLRIGGSPANSAAMDWWIENSKNLECYIPKINLRRFITWIDRTRG